ncbi:MAG: DUF4097 domain-containing protein [Eubacteriales bacterium]|nr:DUF4097 domain-containing protein [Eubacteriales bacterium]
MKTSAIIRVVCWVVIACVLVGVLVWGIGRGTGFSFNFLPVSCVEHGLKGLNEIGALPGDEGPYSQNNDYSVELGSIDTVNIAWVDGSVRVTPYDGDTIAFSESSVGGIPEKYALRYAVNGSTLTIHYCESGINWNTAWWNLGKKLEVLVPKALADSFFGLEIDAVSSSTYVSGLSGDKMHLVTVSGSVGVESVTANTLEIDTTSGSVSAAACTVDAVQVDSVSGSIRLEGSFRSVSTDSVSASANITSAICPSTVKMNTVSGMSTLIIPENSGFTARHDSVSGGFSCVFPATSSNDKAIYGDGSASFSFNSISGGIRIEKNG